jgi:hypothetical protein
MKAPTSQLGVEATGSATSKAANDRGVATYSLIVAMMPPGEQETMMKATASSRRMGQLTNPHRANSTVTTSTVASRHAMLRRRHKTMMTTILGRTLMLRQDDLPCKPSLLVFPPSGSQALNQGTIGGP